MNLPNENTRAGQIADEVKKFYANDFKGIIFNFFLRPNDGLHNLFSGDTEAAYKKAMTLMGSIYVFFVLGLKILLGEMVTVFESIKLSVAPLVTMLVISGVTFGIKSFIGKPNFKNELLTGALAGLPMLFMLIVAIVGQVLFSPTDGDVAALFGGDFGGVANKLGLAFLFLGTAFFYSLLMLINVFQQSLRAGKMKETLCWYLSPLAVFLSIYLAIKVTGVIF